jgi:nucleoside-diphosphate-sugar epimerase
MRDARARARAPLWAIGGGSGFVGIHLARRLLADGLSVRTLDPLPLDPELRARGIEALRGDVRRLRDAAALCRGAQVVVHAAAALPLARSSAQIRSVNVEGTAALLAAAASAGVRRVVVVSSGAVYGLPVSVPVAETATPRPFDAYGRSKLEAEAVCAAFAARGLEIVVLRPAAVVGAQRLGVFGILFRWVREGRRLYTLGAGENRYQLLAVDDLVDAILLAAARAVSGETFNAGATQVGTVRENLEALVAHAGSASRITPLPAGPARVALAALSCARLSPLASWHYESADRDVVLDIGKARRELGFAPRYSNAQALCAAYDWYTHGRRAGPSPNRRPWEERALALARRLS